ncbi:hypothetical protein [Methanothermococcus okinawensis]|uniref:Uncharacterized protein n=1 Tax=Methanothermococcus okinawensis (strain DSM 14208 / JCM 11175 / IH1) TaxID=647113 RepID=F8ANU0_METOI|nr:hypothetical protein [Methanothermococcus okinawensis]AEH06293.1 hypothetical protein Metok_0303 [Methanothermococcus okinawensis IH1]
MGYYYAVIKNGKIVSYGAVRSKKEVIKKAELLKLTGAVLKVINQLEYQAIKEKIDENDKKRMRRYLATRRDLKCVNMI